MDYESPEVAEYRRARDAYFAKALSADAAFLRYFRKLEAGDPTNGAQASRLQNETNYLSADLAAAELKLYGSDLDPREIDRLDGISREGYS